MHSDVMKIKTEEKYNTGGSLMIKNNDWNENGELVQSQWVPSPDDVNGYNYEFKPDYNISTTPQEPRKL